MQIKFPSQQTPLLSKKGPCSFGRCVTFLYFHPTSVVVVVVVVVVAGARVVGWFFSLFLSFFSPLFFTGSAITQLSQCPKGDYSLWESVPVCDLFAGASTQAKHTYSIARTQGTEDNGPQTSLITSWSAWEVGSRLHQVSSWILTSHPIICIRSSKATPR